MERVGFKLVFVMLCFGTTISEQVTVTPLPFDDEDRYGNKLKQETTTMPEILIFHVETELEEGILRLSKVPPINMFDKRDGKSRDISDEHQYKAVYIDINRKSSFIVERHEDLFKLIGNMEIQQRFIHIRPEENNNYVNKYLHYIHNEEILTGDIVAHQLLKNEQQRNKREIVEKFIIEVCFISDAKDFEFYLELYGTRDKAKKEISIYYAFIAEQVKIRFSSIRETTPQLDIQISVIDLLILEDRNESSFTSSFSDQYDKAVDAEDVRNAAAKWVHNALSGIKLPQSDHYMFFTGYILNSTNGNEYAAYATRDAICQGNSISIVNNKRALTGYHASRILGHGIGAQYDGIHGCSDESGYIMSAKISFSNNYTFGHRWWRFSQCSINIFRSKLAEDVCVKNRSSNTEITTTTKGGVYYSVDEQCRLAFGTKSSFCPTTKQLHYPACYKMFCHKPENTTICHGMIPQEYTDCTVDKWCIKGDCIPKTQSAPKLTNLPSTLIIYYGTGGNIFTVQAVDAQRDELYFKDVIKPKIGTEFFRLNVNTGIIFINPNITLNSDTLSVNRFELLVTVKDRYFTSVPQILYIEVKDRPVTFTKNQFTITVNEAKKGSVVITNLRDYVTNPPSAVTFTILPAEHSEKFVIDNYSLKFAIDYDTDPSRFPAEVYFVIFASVPGSLSINSTFVINILNVNQLPSFINLPASVTISENIQPGTTVFTVNATDPDTTDNLRYTAFDSHNVFDMTDNNLVVAPTAIVDYEHTVSGNKMSVKISVSDGKTSSESTLSCLITNVNEPPVFIGSRIINVYEGEAGSKVINNLTKYVVDPEGDAVTFSIQPGPAAEKFKIEHHNNWMLTFAVDYYINSNEFPIQVNVLVKATDSANLTSTSSFDIRINKLNRQPKLLNLPQTITVPGDTKTGILVFTILATDEDTQDIVRYSWLIESGYPISNPFHLDSRTGNVFIAILLSSVSIREYVFRVEATDGERTASELLSIRITDASGLGKENSLTIYYIIGGVVIGVLCLVAVLISAWCYCKRKRPSVVAVKAPTVNVLPISMPMHGIPPGSANRVCPLYDTTHFEHIYSDIDDETYEELTRI